MSAAFSVASALVRLDRDPLQGAPGSSPSTYTSTIPAGATGFGAGAGAGLGAGRGTGRGAGLGAVSYTHLTLPTTPYV